MHAQHLREGGGEPKIILYKITTEMIIVKSLLEFQFCMMKCSILISFHLKNNVYIFISHLFAFTNMYSKIACQAQGLFSRTFEDFKNL